ncbi:MAG: UbiA family prenyltransferase [Phycisphaerae bacterium]|nr:UbiA family prenyltransferase [Phycisphaerae bacterium]HQL54941.1 UbiA family prenyltransferase [Phycisphaerae bacterium]
MIALLRLCRLYYALPMSTILTLTLWYLLGSSIGTQWVGVLCATFALALVIAGGYVLNDVCDWRIDAINMPQRPIPSGHVRRRTALFLALGLFCGGLAFGLACRWQFQLTLLGVIGLLILYNLRAKHWGLGKQLTVAVLMISFYPLAFAQAGLQENSRVGTLFVFPVWLFLTCFGYETLKDIRDTQGDKLITRVPSWIQRRPQFALRVARAAIVAGALALLGPAFLGCGWVYAILVPLPIGLGVWAACLPQLHARMAIYGQLLLVGIAATLDMLILGS